MSTETVLIIFIFLLAGVCFIMLRYYQAMAWEYERKCKEAASLNKTIKYYEQLKLLHEKDTGVLKANNDKLFQDIFNIIDGDETTINTYKIIRRIRNTTDYIMGIEGKANKEYTFKGAPEYIKPDTN